ncbi:hypothetical protein Fmac_021522 [Flemingia macrophylla]|uniref:Uncharacterized protein n=1 Tax=Flemingia macrophylla TaxID=520843 RepID=A0ABD1LX51_9FABA
MGFRLSGIRRASFTAIQAALKSAEVPKGCLAGVCWRESKAICDSHMVFEPTFISRLVESRRGRVWI